MGLFNSNWFFLFEEIVKRNFAAKYKGSVLGILWSVLKPLLVMILLTVIFSTVFHREIENYPVYFLSGKCIYDFFTAGTNVAMNSIKNNRGILTRTAAPKNMFVLGSISSEFINFLISLIILVVVMIVTKAPFNLTTMPLVIIPILSLVLMIIGIGLTLSIFCVYYADIQHLWSVAILMGMYASAIFFPMDIIPEPYHQFMILNPIYWIINQFRMLTLWQTLPSKIYMCNSVLLSTIILIIGIIVFKKYEDKVSMRF